MKPNLIHVIALCHALSSFACAQSTTIRKSPQDPVPGLIARIYVAGSDSKNTPTHLLAVIQNGKEFKDAIQPIAEAKLRESAKKADAVYVASGFIILDKDCTVSFDVGNNNCAVNKKDFGPGTYTQPMKKGKYTVELKRKDHGQGQGKFAITDAATQQSVLFHTGEMLSKELNHSVKLDGKTRKTEQLTAP